LINCSPMLFGLALITGPLLVCRMLPAFTEITVEKLIIYPNVHMSTCIWSSPIPQEFSNGVRFRETTILWDIRRQQNFQIVSDGRTDEQNSMANIHKVYPVLG